MPLFKPEDFLPQNIERTDARIERMNVENAKHATEVAKAEYEYRMDLLESIHQIRDSLAYLVSLEKERQKS